MDGGPSAGKDGGEAAQDDVADGAFTEMRGGIAETECRKAIGVVEGRG